MTRESLDFDENRMTLGFAVAKLRVALDSVRFFYRTTLYVSKSLSGSAVLTPGHSSTHSAVITKNARSTT